MDDDVLGQRLPERSRELDRTRRHRPDQRIEPGKHVGERRQPGDPLASVGLYHHRSCHYYSYLYCPLPRNLSAGSRAPKTRRRGREDAQSAPKRCKNSEESPMKSGLFAFWSSKSTPRNSLAFSMPDHRFSDM